MGDLNQIRNLVFSSDNEACFIERERILGDLTAEMADYQEPDRYALLLSKLLSRVSTPVYDCDYFAGRALEAKPDPGMQAPSMELCTIGHMHPDYATLLKLGLKGILEEIEETARQKGDPESLSFTHNARIVTTALRDFALRYSQSAALAGKSRMAQALARVPWEPAYDFYSALQSVWLIHFVSSCYVGARDYGFGRFDQTLYPFYQQALQEGADPSELTELLAGFFMKTNEICGRHSHNYMQKPVLSQAAKQYVNLGGDQVNPFSHVILEAAKLVNMAQPQFIVLLDPDGDPDFSAHVFETLEVIQDKMNIYNYPLIRDCLIHQGIPEPIAADFTFSACCTMDLHHRTYRLEYYIPVPQLFLKTLCKEDYVSLEALLDAFREELRKDMQAFADHVMQGYDPDSNRKIFVIDSILATETRKELLYPGSGENPWNLLNYFCPGIATIGDSLMTLDRLVFREKRYTYREFMEILDRDYEGQEALRQEILRQVRFGNDTEQDRYTVLAGNLLADVVDSLSLKKNFYAIPAFYSLERDNSWIREVGATPDGRKAGTPFSENQSPTYGADQNGVTALLKSVAKLPFHRAPAGGLNLTFSQPVTARTLQSLITAYLRAGGLHTGITILDRSVLLDAMDHPDRYPALTVRLYGFSEYFISLPLWQQEAVLNRTAY